jgi:small glutamine-rich tetratricopeptide repeat-containing protein alpha
MSHTVEVSPVSERHVSYVLCEWLQEAIAQSGDAELSETLAVGLDVLQSAFDTDVADPQQRAQWSLQGRGTTLASVLGVGLSGREKIENAVSQLQQAQKGPAAPVASSAPAASSSAPAAINDTEEKFADYLRVIAGRGFFGEAKPGSEVYEERYSRARSKFLEKHAPQREAAAPTPAPVAAAPVQQSSEAPGGGDDEPPMAIASAADKAKAEALKAEGNTALQAGDMDRAIDKYTEAIDLDDSVAIYFANRAAAFQHKSDHDMALADCEEAIRRDPNYGKAFTRKGLAHFSLGQFPEAVEAYEKALKLDPGNADIVKSLDQARAKLPAAAPAAGGMPDLSNLAEQLGAGGAGGAGGMPDLANLAQQFGGGAGGMPDLGSMMNNPEMATMAQQAMQNPQLMEMAQQMMSDPEAMQRIMGMMGGMGGGGQ